LLDAVDRSGHGRAVGDRTLDELLVSGIDVGDVGDVEQAQGAAGLAEQGSQHLAHVSCGAGDQQTRGGVGHVFSYLSGSKPCNAHHGSTYFETKSLS